MTSRNLEDALYAFGFGLQCSYVKPFGEGHINETYAVYMPTEEGDEFAYILQRVNNNVFKDPAGVMENIFGVTEYLRNITREEGEIRTERHFPALRQRMDVPISRTMRDSMEML